MRRKTPGAERVDENKGLNNHAVALMHSRLDKCTNRYANAHQKITHISSYRFSPETANAKIINSNLDTKIPAKTEANKISPKELEEQERKKNLDNY